MTVAQRNAIRYIGGDTEYAPKPTTRTVNALMRDGYVSPDDGKLTARGRQEYNRIMSSGNGPEALKEMFKF